MIDRVFAERYEIQEHLGGGGMAHVYKAWDRKLERAVTVKILRDSLTTDEEFVRRFRREAQAIACLSHPNIVNVYDVGREGETDYIVMEYIHGPTLKEVIRRRAPLAPEEAIDLAKQICDALEHAHEQGIVHRDIKPHNILLTRNGRVKVTDFGIARSITQSTMTMTMERTIVGSVHYLSPEQAKGVPVDAKSDIYALGVVLYELLSGRLPFEGDTPIAVALQQIQQTPPALTEVNPQVPAALQEIVLRALEKDPARRYRNARAFKEDLENVFTGQIIGRLPVPDDDSPTMRIGSDLAKLLQAAPLPQQPQPLPQLPPQPFREELQATLPPGGMEMPVMAPNGEEQNQRRKKKRNILIGSVAAMVLVLVGLFWAWKSYMNVPEVKVPDVVGRHHLEATSILQRANLTFTPTTAYSPTVAKDYVISQDPPGGDQLVKQGREIRLTISLGPRNVKLPDVTKKFQQEAMALLQEDFKIEIDEQIHAQIPAGIVIAQFPPGNTEQATGSTVRLTISKGAGEKKPLPNVIGYKVQEAQAKMEELKIDVKLKADETSDAPVGTIVAQDPPPETLVKIGDVVTLTYSGAPATPAPKTLSVTIPVPNDGKEHLVRLVLQDKNGNRQEVYSGKHRGGEAVTKEISYTGETLIQGYVDTTKFLEKTVR
ncbi:Stk1 family PASTA domain-containing Ser/Thr kinase [Heliophilum fasciatum]|uniref:non-specific serine/threonine protein kinase n=1 Tax=Heliophilum fasciatum TaxID=35700 RepID=A0A4R2RUW3_9FIRM|nr:Stk1 family PASTA domain-containing Ser/Thr kinase [Heliophilum fasciatum]MCW2277203.1 serine/threonine-protein kinase [Heliophilum fasciatum]TCP68162.1 serine/threonine-protein kinase [Heliophilum fasciatum]